MFKSVSVLIDMKVDKGFCALGFLQMCINQVRLFTTLNRSLKSLDVYSDITLASHRVTA